MSRFVVVVGTDTGVGKTYVAAGLARLLVASGLRVVAIKPFESGCRPGMEELEDGHLLARATGQPSPTRALCRLVAPLAPPLAADREGRTLDFETAVAEVRRQSEGADLVLVEGAGGALSPLTWDHHNLDLVQALQARVVLVARDGLGTLNHTLLTLDAMARRAIEPTAIVLSGNQNSDESTGSNGASLARLTRFQIVACPDGESPTALSEVFLR